MCQLVLKLPDASVLGRQADTRAGLEQMSLLLLLLLGCAVQCPNKQAFIERIKTLPIDAQHSLVDCIKQVNINVLKFICTDNLGSKVIY